jgi:CBS domain containing-hemolysin-like protein
MPKRAQAQAGDIPRLEMSFDKPYLINSVFGEFDRNLVTIENRLDLIEEIVGEIEDEHHDEPELLFMQMAPDLWEADARAECDDLAEGIDPKLGLIDEDVDTLGGLAFVIAGQVPNVGQLFLHQQSGCRLEIWEADDKRVTRIRLFALVPYPEEVRE